MRRLRNRLRGITLRNRLVAGFVATMFVLLTAAGGFVYWRVQLALDKSLDNTLQNAARVLAPHVSASGHLPRTSSALISVDGFQVVAPDGRVLDGEVRLGTEPILQRDLLLRAQVEPVRQDTGELLVDTHNPLRLYAVPVAAQQDGRPLVLIVAIDRAQQDEALRELLAQLSAAGFATLVVTSFVGGALARAALAPVERYRRGAAEIADGATELRLDVPEDRNDEITRLGHTLNGMLDALEHALERERRFLNDASHELRTPLTLLISRVQLTQRRSRSVAEHEVALDEIATDLSRLTALADQLLDLGTQAPSHGSTDLTAVAQRVVATRTTLAPHGSAYDAPGALMAQDAAPVEVDLDPLSLERLLDNLLDNAALHGVPPVVVGVGQVGRWARLTVTDRGPGIAPDVLTTATERFARAPEARNRPGSGLGLSLVSALVTASGGELRLCSAGRHHRSSAGCPEPCDHGAAMTVTVFLPLSATT